MNIDPTDGDLEELAAAAPVESTAGARYPESSMAAVNRQTARTTDSTRCPYTI
jgi:hypothetical protein